MTDRTKPNLSELKSRLGITSRNKPRKKIFESTYSPYSGTIAVMQEGVGTPGEVRDGFEIEFTHGVEGRKTRIHYFTDNEDKAQELASRTEGDYGHEGTIQRRSLICHTPGVWSPFFPVDGTDDNSTEADIRFRRKRREALAKLSKEDREVLGL